MSEIRKPRLLGVLVTYRRPEHWRRLVDNGMAEDFSWSRQGKLYELVYNRLTKS